MTIISHKFLDHQIDPETEVLIIGTFNPKTDENQAEFFYGRSRNFLWKLLPATFLEESLKNKSKQEKIDFIQKNKIDFIDLISSVEVDEVSNYDDKYLDKKVSEWRDVISEIEKLRNIKRVCFTRKSFSDIPNMKSKIEAVCKFCEERKIGFRYLTTPARFYRADKQTEWSKFFNNDY